MKFFYLDNVSYGAFEAYLVLSYIAFSVSFWSIIFTVAFYPPLWNLLHVKLLGKTKHLYIFLLRLHSFKIMCLNQ